MADEQHIEALLLDYLEGRLDETDRARVEAYLSAHPDVRDALEGMDDAVLKPEGETLDDREALKMPSGNHPTQAEARQRLYCLAMDGELAPEERVKLYALTARREYREEYEAFQALRLRPETTPTDKSALYRTGEVLPLTEATYEDYLTARGEGLLDGEQSRALESFARLRPRGTRDLKEADALRLRPPAGIFYPDKAKLYRQKSGGRLWWYRVAAAAAVLLLIWWNFPIGGPGDTVGGAAMTPLSPKQAGTVTVGGTATLPQNLSAPAVFAATVSGGIATSGTSTVRVALTSETGNSTDRPEMALADMTEMPLKHATARYLAPTEDPGTPVLPPSAFSDETLAETTDKNPSQKDAIDPYLTVPQWLKEKTLDPWTDRITLPDRPVMAMADELTHRAGEILDAKVSSHSQETAGGVRRTFSMRIGNFAFERSTTK